MNHAAELARWNQRFDCDEYHFGTAPNRFLASQAQLLKPGTTALCVADGEGRNSVWLAEQGLRVTAFDFSPVAVEKARRLAVTRGVVVEHRLADINEWDWATGRFDLVAAIFVQFASPAERERMFAGIAHSLAPGGLLLMQGYTPKQLEYGTGGPKHIDYLYTEALLRKAFDSLEVLLLREHEEEVDEGSAHCGMSALIDFAARRPLT